MKTRIIMLLAPFVLAGALGVFGGEKTDSAAASKRADIKRMMELSGAGNLGVQAMNQMISAFKQGDANIPEKFWEDFVAEVDPNKLVDICIPSYEKHLTHEDVKELIKFYETRIGKKLVKVQPQIVQECMIAGQEWGRKLGEKIARRLQEEGY